MQTYFPGVLVSLIIAIAATFLSEHYGGPVMLFALLLGMAFYFLSQEGPCVAGIEFASKRILRVAVGLLGAQITIAEIMKLGPTPVVMVIGAVTAHYSVRRARRARRRLEPAVRNFDRRRGGDLRRLRGAGDLVGPAERRKPRARYGFHGDRRHRAEHDRDDRLSGDHRFFPSRSCRDRGVPRRHHPRRRPGGRRRLFSVSEETGNVATFTKLLRVAMLLPVVVTLSFVFHAHNTSKAGRQLPGFLVVFAVLVVINSLGVIPAPVLVAMKEHLALVPGDGDRRAGDENVAQGDGGGGRPRDRADRRRDGVSRDPRAGDRGVEILNGKSRLRPRNNEKGLVR